MSSWVVAPSAAAKKMSSNSSSSVERGGREVDRPKHEWFACGCMGGRLMFWVMGMWSLMSSVATDAGELLLIFSMMALLGVGVVLQ